MTLQAFHNDPALKAALLAEVGKHELADQIIAGTYAQFDDAGEWTGGCE